MELVMGSKRVRTYFVVELAALLGLVVFCNLVAMPLVSGTPFAIPGRALPSPHKQMRVIGDAGSGQGELLTSERSMTSEELIRLSDGDTVTCIPMLKQPSLSHFENPEIQLKPSSHPEPAMYAKSGSSSDEHHPNGTKTASQVFAQEFGKCPKGHIPVRRGRTSSSGFPAAADAATQGLQSTGSTSRQYVHQHAYAATTISRPPSYKGTQVVMNVWQPFVEPRDFSLAQLWVMNTGLSFTPGGINWPMNSIEAGWQVYSDLYGDQQPRLFVYWTGDGYVETGCYNLNQDCPKGSPGFVQVSSKVLLGGAISPPSAVNSDQYEIKLRVFKDDESGNWWLQFNQDYVGYWPRSLFHSLRDTSDLIQWGGEVFDVREGDGQTRTHMGSGCEADTGFGKAAYQRSLQYVAMDNKLHDAQDLQAVSTKPSCYGVSTASSPAWGQHFYYGGRC